MKDSYLYDLFTNHSPHRFQYLRAIGPLLVAFILTMLYLWLLSPSVQANSLDAIERQASWQSSLSTTTKLSNYFIVLNLLYIPHFFHRCWSRWVASSFGRISRFYTFDQNESIRTEKETTMPSSENVNSGCPSLFLLAVVYWKNSKKCTFFLVMLSAILLYTSATWNSELVFEWERWSLWCRLRSSSVGGWWSYRFKCIIATKICPWLCHYHILSTL